MSRVTGRSATWTPPDDWNGRTRRKGRSGYQVVGDKWSTLCEGIARMNVDPWTYITAVFDTAVVNGVMPIPGRLLSDDAVRAWAQSAPSLVRSLASRLHTMMSRLGSRTTMNMRSMPAGKAVLASLTEPSSGFCPLFGVCAAAVAAKEHGVATFRKYVRDNKQSAVAQLAPMLYLYKTAWGDFLPPELIAAAEAARNGVL